MDLKLRNDRGFNNRQDDGDSAAPAFALYRHDKSCPRPLGRLCSAQRPRTPACRSMTLSCPLPATTLAPRILVRRNNAPPAPPSTTFPHYPRADLHTPGAEMVVASHLPRQARRSRPKCFCGATSSAASSAPVFVAASLSRYA